MMKNPGGTDGDPFSPWGFSRCGRPSSDILIDGRGEINKGSVARQNGRGNRELSEQDKVRRGSPDPAA
jgi:hypothetical protein